MIKTNSAIPELFRTAFAGLIVLFGLYMTSRYNYLLFHVFAELFSIIIGCCIFMVAWNSRRIINNNFLLFLGIAYLFVALLDMAHMLTYKGMGMIREGTANIPTQLWISARYIESLSLLIAALLLNKRINSRLVFICYGTLILLVSGSIFYWDIFPDCFLEETGLTPFKVYSEYIISMIMLASAFILYRHRSFLDAAVFKLLTASIGISILSELFFTFYVHVYGVSNLAGHFLKLISFFLIYKAIIEKGLMDPYNLLFRDLKLSTEAQRASEEKYKNLADTSLAGIYVSNIAGDLLFANDCLARMLEYSSAGEMMKLSAGSIYRKSEERTSLIEKLKIYGKVDNIELELLTKSGKTINTMVNAKLEQDKISKVVIDITDRKRAEQEEVRLRKSLEAQWEIARMVDSDDRTIYDTILEALIDITESKYSYYGLLNDDETILTIHTWSASTMKDCGMKEKPIEFHLKDAGPWGDAVRERKTIIANNYGDNNKGLPDGHVSIKRLLTVPVIKHNRIVAIGAVADKSVAYTEKDAEQMSAFLESAQLIQEKRNAEEELTAHRERLMELVAERTRALHTSYEQLVKEFNARKDTEKELRLMALFAELNPAPILRFDIAGNITNANPAATRLLNIDLEKSPSLFRALPSLEGLEIGDCIQNARTLSYYAEIGDSYYHLIIKGVPDIKIANVYGTDITEQKKTEAEMIRASQLALMGEVAAGVAHEVNNPINGIINYTRIIANRSDPESEEHEIAGRIIKESNRIAGIVKDLLFFARDGKDERYPIPIDKIMSDSLALVRAQMEKDGIRLNVRTSAGLPQIIASPQRIEQVFLNVLSNARYALNRKYTIPHPDKVLEIYHEEILIEEHPFIRTVFYDRGIGISKEILDRIRDRFFSTKAVSEGTGLGLSITDTIITDHGGSLSIESSEREYTRITIDLPASAEQQFNDNSLRRGLINRST